jgi:glutamate carboxypeptidase
MTWGARSLDLLAELRPREDELLQVLAELVAIPSHASQPDGVRAVGERVGTELAALGFELDIAELPASAPAPPPWAATILTDGIGVDELVPPVTWRRDGEHRRELLLLGDLDAAMRLSASDCRLTIVDGRAAGPAVADMKGGLAVLIGALRALADVGLATPAITVVLSGDEQAGSLLSRHTITARGRSADWCICLECARDGGFLMGSRGHVGVGRIQATGVETHAGSAPDAGVNAIALLVEALAGLTHIETPALTALTMIRGGRRRSVVPGEAMAVLDVRARSAEEWAQTEAALAKLAEDISAPERISLDLYSHRPALAWTRHTDWFLDLVRRAGEPLGISVGAIASMAAGSSAFVDATRMPVLDGMGPVGGALMTSNEYIEVDSLVTRSALLAATIAALPTPAAGTE